jgi:hypothetical protein
LTEDQEKRMREAKQVVAVVRNEAIKAQREAKLAEETKAYDELLALTEASLYETLQGFSDGFGVVFNLTPEDIKAFDTKVLATFVTVAEMHFSHSSPEGVAYYRTLHGARPWFELVSSSDKFIRAVAHNYVQSMRKAIQFSHQRQDYDLQLREKGKDMLAKIAPGVSHPKATESIAAKAVKVMLQGKHKAHFAPTPKSKASNPKGQKGNKSPKVTGSKAKDTAMEIDEDFPSASLGRGRTQSINGKRQLDNRTGGAPPRSRSRKSAGTSDDNSTKGSRPKHSQGRSPSLRKKKGASSA